ncbi:hypothetical protein AB0H57_14160 [Micromonospora sp. NPDC050686]|uniref:hypothetical protein n=1 Tax=Micromonospora sp. NPDC050686 TaxID=3154631 RepID=UPI0033E06C18
MKGVTGRPAAAGRDEPHSAAVEGAAPPRRTPGRSSGAVAPQPRPGPAESAETDGTAAAEDQARVEPTTGAPVDALPRRVPIRQPRWRRRGRDGGEPPAEPDDDLFWAPIEEVHWDGTPLRAEPASGRERAPAGGRDARPTRSPRPPDPPRGLAVLVALSLVAAFFGWVSAGPFWLAVGHANEGTVVIGNCTGAGLSQRCRGIFTAEGERFVAHGVRVSGVPRERASTGAALPARMTGADADTAYADRGAGRHLRWLLGLLLVLACGAGIARWTGATRLPEPRARRWAVAAAVGGPVLISAGFLAAAW